MNRRKLLWVLFSTLLAFPFAYVWLAPNPNPFRRIGAPLDSMDGVAVYYNGRGSRADGRHQASDGYNYGQKYQCVEFAKRYYHDALGHSMPESYGHAKDFFDPSVKAGKLNKHRGLLQFPNGGATQPKHGDLVVWGATSKNPYGHVAIVASTSKESCEVIQQNAGPWGSSRRHLRMLQKDGKVTLPKPILGWLRLPQ